jgi:hypothetical protein
VAINKTFENFSLDRARSMLPGFGASGLTLAGGSFRVTVICDGAPAKTLSLDGGSYLFAPDRQADIVLLSNQDPSAFRLELPSGSGAPAMIAALTDKVIANGQAVAPGSPQSVSIPLTITAGATKIEIKSSNSLAVLQQPIPKPVKVMALASIFAACLAMLLPHQIDLDRFGSGSSPAPASVPAQWNSISEAVKSAQGLINRVDLSERIKVVAQNGTLRLSGEVGGSEVRRWQDAEAIIRSRSSVKVETSVRLDPSESTAGRGIAGVALAPERYVLARNGQRLRIGETLPEGWVIRDIDETRVLLERDGFSESLTF